MLRPYPGRAPDGSALRGRRVLITGASSGIGLTAARVLSERGARLALVARDAEALEAAAVQARERGGEAHVLPADVADHDALRAAVEGATAALGGLDLVIAAAGAASYGRLRDVPPADLRRTLEVICAGALETVLLALPALEASGGRAVVLGSSVARHPMPLLGPYTAGKHALRGAIGSLRAELLAEGSPVRVSLVHPGPVRTPFWPRVTSSTGRLPPVPPLRTSPERVVHTILRVATAEHPPREVAVGPLSLLAPLGAALVPPVADRILAQVGRLLLRTGPEAGDDGALRHVRHPGTPGSATTRRGWLPFPRPGRRSS